MVANDHRCWGHTELSREQNPLQFSSQERRTESCRSGREARPAAEASHLTSGAPTNDSKPIWSQRVKQQSLLTSRGAGLSRQTNSA
eukprot:CAMPEP_0184748708 /NCGR_PEP_ID=MMETSP0315-20130426/21907_1 /TAXON_ID=101924 /ORGANISM="Rhodosorus marinus, Strain UTEX LB 2760" /LENGTH=85 /DNA_ID=CAMNT_0027224477 /DNA_START=182 /DNA_END=439 /DNA_ORIENTATION=-